MEVAAYRVARSASRMHSIESKLPETPMALSSAYRNCFEMVVGMTAEHMFKEDGADKEPWRRRYAAGLSLTTSFTR